MHKLSMDGWMDDSVTKLRRICSIKKKNQTIFPSNLTLAGSEFHTVGAATEKARVPAFDLRI